MEALSFNSSHASSFLNNDVLSAFKETSEKNLTIQQGMSVKEISDIVSEKIIAVVKNQFEATKNQYETIEKNKSSNK